MEKSLKKIITSMSQWELLKRLLLLMPNVPKVFSPPSVTAISLLK